MVKNFAGMVADFRAASRPVVGPLAPGAERSAAALAAAAG